MIRDPFDIYKKSTLVGAASRATLQLRNAAAQITTDGIEAMAFSMPRNLPDFADPTREMEDRAWASVSRRGASGKGGIIGGVSDKVAGMFGEDSLPMYKDKPYGYASSRRRRPLWRRKRAMVLVVTLLISLLYYLGYFGSSGENRGVVPWSWTSLTQERDIVNWDSRRQHVVEAFELSWDAYERYAWGYDEYHPIARTGKYMAPKGLGWIIIDSLDTLILMNQTSRLQHAREWLSTTLTWEQDQDVSTFETTIRMLGGLLAAHYLSNEYPDLAPIKDDNAGEAGEDLYLEKAKDLADRLMSAFETPSGVPYSSVNLDKFKGIPSHDDMGAASTAEATSIQLEFKYLAKLTGEKVFWDSVEKVMAIVDEDAPEAGLVPIYIYPTNGEFRGENIRLGSRGDSYYEYLIKQYLQTNKQEPIYEEMWNEALQGVKDHLVTYTEPSGFTIIGERPNGLHKPLSPKMDHLVCFMPGTIALSVTGGLTEAEAKKQPSWNKKSEENMQLARELMQTCWGMYKFMATGLAAEITYFNIADPPPSASAPHNPPTEFDPDPNATWRKDYDVKANDVHNLQRPETVESLFYMWRITGDIKYRQWGWEMFMSFANHTAVEHQGGFTSLINANVIPPKTKDNMESFWLAETLKYLYLLFSPNDLLPLDKIVLNTEAHPLPRFDMGPLLSTGWKRKPRVAVGGGT